MTTNHKLIIPLLFVVYLFSCHYNTRKKAAENRDTIATSSITIDESVDNSKSNQTLKDSTIKPKEQNYTKLIFPNFSINLHDFRVYDPNNDGQFEYDGDTSGVSVDIDDNNVWTVTSKTDTLHLNSNEDNSFDYNLIEIIPHNKIDKFKISYALKANLSTVNTKQDFGWKGITEYHSLNDSLYYFFKVPKSAYYDDVLKELKKKLKLRDTSVVYNDGDYGNGTATLSYKNNGCTFALDGIYLKIERFGGNELKDTKFVCIYFDDVD